MHPSRVYCIEVTGGCEHRSLTCTTGDGVRDVMRRHQVVVFAAAAAALLVTGCAQAAADRAQPVLRHEPAGAAGSWGRRTAVPGLGALNKGSVLGVSAVSCASAASRVAGGYYQETGRFALQGFVT